MILVSGRMIVFDSSLESRVNFTQGSQPNEAEHGVSYAAYFLVGSFCSDGEIHVAHMAPCPLPVTATDSAGDTLSKTLDEEWIADNAEKVTRILPGGKPMGLVTDVVNRGPDSPTKVSFSVVRKLLDVISYLMIYKFLHLEWVSAVSSASARICLNVPTKMKQPHFFTEFIAAIRPFTENLFNCSLALINGEIRDESEQLFQDVKKKKADAVEVELFVDACENKGNTCEPQSATNLHEVSFDIEIRAAVPLKSKVSFAVAAVKQHLIRSLTARAELQYESMDVVEEAAAGPCSVHQMPRPATTVLDTHPAILFSDYLFEADTVEDAQSNFDELLGLKANKEHIDEGWERCLEINEMEVVRAPLDDTPTVNLKPKDGDIGSILSLLIALSVIIAVVSIVVYFVIAR
ncbi:unnamed protein product [Angiostrongylus costaricensis]|uniref:ZP domain-containing protein n=1 Tax=Angiostrongylus costaricensis TaxID=334426 RepID=A0A158PFS2_ANGCS|nr:unnamed protein product [Angiostrongylus costaricensis]